MFPIQGDLLPKLLCSFPKLKHQTTCGGVVAPKQFPLNNSGVPQHCTEEVHSEFVAVVHPTFLSEPGLAPDRISHAQRLLSVFEPSRAKLSVAVRSVTVLFPTVNHKVTNMLCTCHQVNLRLLCDHALCS